MQRYVMAVVAVISVALAAGCTKRVGDLTTVSTKNVRGLSYSEKGRVKGEDCSHTVFIIPFGDPDLKEALDNAINQSRGDMMVDAVVYQSSWYIPFIYGQSCFKVEGTVVDSMEVTKKKEIKE